MLIDVILLTLASVFSMIAINSFVAALRIGLGIDHIPNYGKKYKPLVYKIYKDRVEYVDSETSR